MTAVNSRMHLRLTLLNHGDGVGGLPEDRYFYQAKAVSGLERLTLYRAKNHVW